MVLIAWKGRVITTMMLVIATVIAWYYLGLWSIKLVKEVLKGFVYTMRIYSAWNRHLVVDNSL